MFFFFFPPCSFPPHTLCCWITASFYTCPPSFPHNSCRHMITGLSEHWNERFNTAYNHIHRCHSSSYVFFCQFHHSFPFVTPPALVILLFIIIIIIIILIIVIMVIMTPWKVYSVEHRPWSIVTEPVQILNPPYSLDRWWWWDDPLLSPRSHLHVTTGSPQRRYSHAHIAHALTYSLYYLSVG